ncbi:DUF58 domain-containing protein [Arthrobacter gengyunqii]|uniref:DUF58 domain-containing protein n=1 Tax=Arthrobacter gengyunqii TaxID=2886940 RepID=A0A9X1S854_9MICC|nr:DUF58 domain-containing protein [Arthrobacter gengyunqii]MCC3269624.1 DUF58 domain-containing protein [Arthrobacter gengyunqii]UOY97086.1 DUF58 domain-containing protein [Arthrobacter gengyunqii]
MEFASAARLLTPRGWGLIAAGIAALLTAQIMGRRDALILGLFLVSLPLLSALALRLIKPVFVVERSFSPATVETGVPARVALSLRTPRPVRQSAAMREGLPLRFGQSPVFRFPARFPDADGASTYEYQLRSARRGMFPIGPVTAEFSDLFGLARRLHVLGATDPLVVAPAPQELPATALGGPRGTEGSVHSPRRGGPSEDDVSTREYRAGDPMRRVHWAATARHGELMVRQEEPVTSPGATLLLDARQSCFSGGMGAPLWTDPAGGNGLSTSESFEWAVTAAVSAAAHLVENGYSLHLLDVYARPGLARSPSAPNPQQQDFSGTAGLQDIAEGLAALELETRADERLAEAGAARPPGTDLTTPENRSPIGSALLDSLAQRRRGPLVAVLGRLSADDAARLAPAADYATRACAILVTDRLQEAGPALAVLHSGGWQAVAATPESDLARTWAAFASAAQPMTSLTSSAGRENPS